MFFSFLQPKAERERVLTQQYEERRRQRIKDMEGRNVFVKCLPDSVDDEKLREMFSEFGTITSARVMKHANGITKNFGFVCFASKDDSQKAIQKMSGKHVEGKPLYVAMALRMEEREKAMMGLRGISMGGFPAMMPGMMPYGMVPGPGMPQPGRPGMPGVRKSVV